MRLTPADISSFLQRIRNQLPWLKMKTKSQKLDPVGCSHEEADHTTFMWKALTNAAGEQVSFPEAQERYQLTMKHFLDDFPDEKKWWAFHEQVLKFLDANSLRRSFMGDFQFKRMAFDECPPDMKVEEKVVLGETVWMKLLRHRAETLGYRDELFDEAIMKARCFKCGEKSSEKRKRCSRCHKTWYCDVECQRLDWPEHKAMCNLE